MNQFIVTFDLLLWSATKRKVCLLQSRVIVSGCASVNLNLRQRLLCVMMGGSQVNTIRQWGSQERKRQEAKTWAQL